MSNIYNFTNRQMCEYASIFPTVASLLDHLLLTIGNGYSFSQKLGLPIDGDRVLITDYPTMTDQEWDNLIAECHQKELNWEKKHVEFHRRHNPNAKIDEEFLAKNCARYKRVSVTDEDFSYESLLKDLLQMDDDRRINEMSHGEYYLRPYPLAEEYSAVFKINDNTPKWFVFIAYNFCKAWVTFLNREIEIGNIWIPISKRPKVEATAEQLLRAEGMKELFDMIRADDDYDGWLDNQEEKVSDYGDLSWTIKHRDMLIDEAQRLEAML